MQEHSLSNRLATLATAVDDATAAALGELSPSAAAALMVIRRLEPIAIQDIAVRVGLTHSATVRLIDRLEKDWLVRRLRRRGREVLVEATARGKRRARDMQARRLAGVEALLSRLDPDQQDTLGEIIDLLLPDLVSDDATAARLCRFCDLKSCGADCPLHGGDAAPAV